MASEATARAEAVRAAQGADDSADDTPGAGPPDGKQPPWAAVAIVVVAVAIAAAMFVVLA